MSISLTQSGASAALGWMIAAGLLSVGALGCFGSHGGRSEPVAEPGPAPTSSADGGMPTSTSTPTARTPGPSYDLCPEVPYAREDLCICGAERLPHPDDDGRCFPCTPCDCTDPDIDVGPEFHDEAFLSWNFQSGAAGIGPTLTIRGDGRVRFWEETGSVRPGEEPEAEPDREYEIGSPLYLFDRLSHGDGAVPHGPVRLECEQLIYARNCTDCEPRVIRFGELSQVIPELGCFLDLLATVLPADIYWTLTEYCRWTP